MRIVAYSTTSENNVVEKSFTLRSTFDGTLRAPCSILRPVIEFAYVGIPSNWTHLFIIDFNRWYFINDIVSVNNGLVRISARVDVLETYHGVRNDETGLYALTGYVTRNQFNHDYRLTDTRYPMYINPTITRVTASVLSGQPMWYSSSEYLNAQDTAYRYMLIMQGTQESSGGTEISKNYPLSTLATTSAPFATLTSNLGSQSITSSLNITGKTVTDYIYNIGALPIQIPLDPNLPQVHHINIPGLLSNLQLPAGFYSVARNASVISTKFRATITKSSATVHYLNKSPFTRYSVTFQPFGKFELDPKYFMPDTTAASIYVYFRIEIDTLTGNALLYYGDADAKVYLSSANVFYKMPLSSSAYNGAALASSAVSIVGSAISAVATEGATTPALVGAVAGGAQALATPNASISGGDTKIIDKAPVVEIMYAAQAQKNDSLFGQLLCQPLALKSVYGYTEINRIHLDGFAATVDEKEELERLLATGVIFPEQ